MLLVKFARECLSFNNVNFNMEISKQCFVPNCSNNSGDNPNKIFISVPKDRNIRTRWLHAVNRWDIVKIVLYCCEDHFNLEQDAENFMQYKVLHKRLTMKKDAIPHLNLLGTDVAQAMQSQLSESAKKRKMHFHSGSGSRRRLSFEDASGFSSITKIPFVGPGSQVSILTLPSAEIVPSESETFPFKITTPPRRPVYTEVSSPSGKFTVTPIREGRTIQKDKTVQAALKVACKHVASQAKPKSQSVYVQVRLPAQEVPKATLVDVSEEYESTSNGSEYWPSEASTSTTSSETTKIKIKSIKDAFSKNTFEKLKLASRFYLGLPQDVYSMVSLLEKTCNISSPNILITLKKIRLNDPYKRMELDFGLSSTTLSNVFNSSVPKLAAVMQELIIWPNATAIKKIVPVSFRARYGNVQSIIDCLEIEIDKPANPLHQSLTWSEYKKCNTVKYLISSTPNGLINFVSVGFGGRTTDRSIIEHSGFLDVLPEGAVVMADRGFKQIANLLSKKHCTLVRPPSVSTAEKSSKAEVKESKRIASLRIHIERVIRRLREFSMLAPHACINLNFIDKIDLVMLIACAIVNLQGPLIK